mmetsp:Transcript_36654/g.44803  ORF Transcript_36654/g.44803 Transcript_36654/m.44803 type:complete len:99 (+) Transcript_36654:494-790(+)
MAKLEGYSEEMTRRTEPFAMACGWYSYRDEITKLREIKDSHSVSVGNTDFMNYLRILVLFDQFVTMGIRVRLPSLHFISNFTVEHDAALVQRLPCSFT